MKKLLIFSDRTFNRFGKYQQHKRALRNMHLWDRLWCYCKLTLEMEKILCMMWYDNNDTLSISLVYLTTISHSFLLPHSFRVLPTSSHFDDSTLHKKITNQQAKPKTSTIIIVVVPPLQFTTSNNGACMMICTTSVSVESRVKLKDLTLYSLA